MRLSAARLGAVSVSKTSSAVTIFMTLRYPVGLNVAATRARAALCWSGVISPSLTPLRSAAPDCITIPVGRLDQRVLYSLVKLTLAFARLVSSSVARKALAAATALAVGSPATDLRAVFACQAPGVATGSMELAAGDSMNRTSKV